MVKDPPGISAIGAPSRSPTISIGQPEACTAVPGLARNPLGKGLVGCPGFEGGTAV